MVLYSLYALLSGCHMNSDPTMSSPSEEDTDLEEVTQQTDESAFEDCPEVLPEIIPETNGTLKKIPAGENLIIRLATGGEIIDNPSQVDKWLLGRSTLGLFVKRTSCLGNV